MSQQPVDIEKYVGHYIQLRDLIKKEDDEHKEKMKPKREMLDQLNGLLLQALQTQNVESARTSHGTVYTTNKKSASIADMPAFWTYVITQGEFELLDKRANVKAVEDFITAHNTPPPGVNFTTVRVVGVRRS